MIGQDVINNIEAKTAEILREIYGKSLDEIMPPIDISQILEQYHIDLKSGNFPDENISGAYDKALKTIYIADDEPKSRKIFTVAHELGHYFLHDTEGDIYYRKQSLNLVDENSFDETEANWFAASLLMPQSLVVKAWNVLKDVQKVSEIFEVSYPAAYFRLKNLKLVE